MKKLYEAWDDSEDEEVGGITFAPPETIQELRSKGLLSKNAKLTFWVIADTFEEALAVRNIKLGWGPYVPEGEPKECPRGCAAMFYPEGSGECPNCGAIC